jgi:hypothetical protein
MVIIPSNSLLRGEELLITSTTILLTVLKNHGAMLIALSPKRGGA